MSGCRRDPPFRQRARAPRHPTPVSIAESAAALISSPVEPKFPVDTLAADRNAATAGNA